jgi:hypothetical protein
VVALTVYLHPAAPNLVLRTAAESRKKSPSALRNNNRHVGGLIGMSLLGLDMWGLAF